MTEIAKFDLNDLAFAKLELDLKEYQRNFYLNKRVIPNTISQKEALSSFKRSDFNFKTFLHEYDMNYIVRRDENKTIIIKAFLDPVFRKYIMYVSKFLCQHSASLKPAYTLQGKNAEGVFMLFVNNILNYFRFHSRLEFSKKSMLTGGDGGSDFKLDDMRFDVKHRDDRPGSGLILRERFLNNAEDDVIIVLATNGSNIKLGDLVSNSNDIEKAVADQTLQVALTGWTTIADFKKNKKPHPGVGSGDQAYCLDELNDMASLLNLIVERQIKSSSLFTAP